MKFAALATSPRALSADEVYALDALVVSLQFFGQIVIANFEFNLIVSKRISFRCFPVLPDFAADNASLGGLY
jgi:hypothetical protein